MRHDIIFFPTDIYPTPFIETFGTHSEHWNKETNESRERFLRHNMVCALLGNLEHRPLVKPDPDDMKVEQAESDDGNSDDDNELTLRFRVLEGKSPTIIAGNYTNLMSKWGMPAKPTGKWDIIDTVEKKFIEVKVTKFLEKDIRNFKTASLGIESFTALYHIHSDTFEITTINCDRNLRGTAKAINFLRARDMYFAKINLKSNENQGYQAWMPYVFNDQYTNSKVKEWYTPMYDLAKKDTMPFKEGTKTNMIGFLNEDFLIYHTQLKYLQKIVRSCLTRATTCIIMCRKYPTYQETVPILGL